MQLRTLRRLRVRQGWTLQAVAAKLVYADLLDSFWWSHDPINFPYLFELTAAGQLNE